MKITRVHRETFQVPAAGLRVSCPICEQEVDLLTEGDAMQILEVSVQVLCARIATGEIHAVLPANGPLGICKDSVLARKRIAGLLEPH